MTEKETEAEIFGRLYGLSDEEAGWLCAAYTAVEMLNASLEQRNQSERWRVLMNSDPRRVVKERKL